MDWFPLALGAAFFFSCSTVLSRYLLREGGNPLAFTALHDGISGLVLLPFALWFADLPSVWNVWLLLGAAVLMLFICDLCKFTALKDIPVSIYQIVAQIRHILAPITALCVFGEELNMALAGSIALIISGVVVVLYEGQRLNISRGVILTIGNSVFAVLGWSFIKSASGETPGVILAALVLLGIALLAAIGCSRNPASLRKEWELNGRGLLWAGLAFGAFEICMFSALAVGPMSKVVPVTQSTLVFTVLAGVLLLHERERIAQKLGGMVLIVIGVLLLR